LSLICFSMVSVSFFLFMLDGTSLLSDSEW
jgi:hypothetical protein